MEIVIDTRKTAEQAQILKLALSYRIACASGSKLSGHFNKILDFHLVVLQTMLADQGPSKWFFDTFINKVGTFGGIAFVCESTITGYIIEVKKLIKSKEVANESA
jgi:hypothetical protein